LGTLVSYSASRTEQGFRRSNALVPELPYPDFPTLMDTTFAGFDRRADEWRNPHAAICRAALTADPAEAVFVGNSYVADYAGRRGLASSRSSSTRPARPCPRFAPPGHGIRPAVAGVTRISGMLGGCASRHPTARPPGATQTRHVVLRT
jgi:hypothetical protein